MLLRHSVTRCYNRGHQGRLIAKRRAFAKAGLLLLRLWRGHCGRRAARLQVELLIASYKLVVIYILLVLTGTIAYVRALMALIVI
jgi:hypothetical protein